MILVQVLICVYIVCYYPNMEADADESIMTQVNKNQFSGQMVVVLTLVILLIIYDRYIYKTKRLENSSKDDQAIVPVNRLPRNAINFTHV